MHSAGTTRRRPAARPGRAARRGSRGCRPGARSAPTPRAPPAAAGSWSCPRSPARAPPHSGSQPRSRAIAGPSRALRSIPDSIACMSGVTDLTSMTTRARRPGATRGRRSTRAPRSARTTPRRPRSQPSAVSRRTTSSTSRAWPSSRRRSRPSPSQRSTASIEASRAAASASRVSIVIPCRRPRSTRQTTERETPTARPRSSWRQPRRTRSARTARPSFLRSIAGNDDRRRFRSPLRHNHAPPRLAPEMPAMCFDHDSRPPIAPIAGGSLDAQEIVLEGADGNRFSAYLARAAEPTRCRDGRAAGRARPPRLLPRPRAAVRGARRGRDRHRLLRADRGDRRPRARVRLGASTSRRPRTRGCART